MGIAAAGAASCPELKVVYMRPALTGVRKYHRDIYFPDQLERLCRAILSKHQRSYRLSGHARDRLFEKGVDLRGPLPLGRCEVIEATMHGQLVEKILVRFPYDTQDDLVFGLTHHGVVTTCYWNARNDEHKTLRVSEYVRVA